MMLARTNLRERIIRDIKSARLGDEENYSGPKGAGSAAFTFHGRLVPAVALSPYCLPRHLNAGAKSLLRQSQSIRRDGNGIWFAVDCNLSPDCSFELRGHDLVIPAARKPVRTRLQLIRRPAPPRRNQRTTRAAAVERTRSVLHRPILAFHGPVAVLAASVTDIAVLEAKAP